MKTFRAFLLESNIKKSYLISPEGKVIYVQQHSKAAQPIMKEYFIKTFCNGNPNIYNKIRKEIDQDKILVIFTAKNLQDVFKEFNVEPPILDKKQFAELADAISSKGYASGAVDYLLKHLNYIRVCSGSIEVGKLSEEVLKRIYNAFGNDNPNYVIDYIEVSGANSMVFKDVPLEELKGGNMRNLIQYRKRF